ncbi:hypothetical protein GE09DRAFT_1273450 [Coniochaeta sp. 2T2.1]|nr:hypothetical protein GE09DRAFT_1273450 [Coniochaeta sp. 2T2.1]
MAFCGMVGRGCNGVVGKVTSDWAPGLCSDCLKPNHNPGKREEEAVKLRAEAEKKQKKEEEERKKRLGQAYAVVPYADGSNGISQGEYMERCPSFGTTCLGPKGTPESRVVDKFSERKCYDCEHLRAKDWNPEATREDERRRAERAKTQPDLRSWGHPDTEPPVLKTLPSGRVEFGEVVEGGEERREKGKERGKEEGGGRGAAADPVVVDEGRGETGGKGIGYDGRIPDIIVTSPGSAQENGGGRQGTGQRDLGYGEGVGGGRRGTVADTILGEGQEETRQESHLGDRQVPRELAPAPKSDWAEERAQQGTEQQNAKKRKPDDEESQETGEGRHKKPRC